MAILADLATSFLGRIRGTRSVRLNGIVSTPSPPAPMGGGGTNPVTSGLAAHYDASDLALTNGAAVASWPDKSGNGRTLTQATGSAQPTYVASAIGGRPAVRADGVDDVMDQTAPAFTPRQAIVVFTSDSTSGFHGLIGGKVDAGTFTELIFTTDTTGANWETGTGNGGTYYGNGVLGNVAVTQPAGTPRISSVSRTLLTSLSLRIFMDRSNGRPWNGLLAEALIYDRVLTDTERQQVESYLSTKYGIALASGLTSYPASYPSTY